MNFFLILLKNKKILGSLPKGEGLIYRFNIMKKISFYFVLLIIMHYSSSSFCQTNNPLDSLFTRHFSRISNYKHVFIVNDNYFFNSKKSYGLRKIKRLDGISNYSQNRDFIEISFSKVDSIEFKDSIHSNFDYTIYYLVFNSLEHKGKVFYNGETFYFTAVRMKYATQNYYFIFKEELVSAELLYALPHSIR